MQSDLILDVESERVAGALVLQIVNARLQIVIGVLVLATIVAVLPAHLQRVSGELRAELPFSAEPLADRGVAIHVGVGRVARLRRVIRVGAAVPVVVDEDARLQLNRLADAAIVAELQIRPAIPGLLARIVEDRVERGRRDLLAAVGEEPGERPRAIAQLGEQAIDTLVVETARDTVVTRAQLVADALVELRVVQARGSVALIAGGRRQPFETVCITLAVRGTAPARVQAAAFASQLDAVELRAALGDDVDDAEERAAAVQRRARPANHFHSLDELHIDHTFAAGVSAVVDAVVHPVAVDRHQQAGVVVARPQKAAHTDILIVAIVGDVEAAHVAQHVSERAVAEAADIVRSDDRHGRWRLRHLLLVLGCAVHGVHADLHQFFDAQIGDVLAVRRLLCLDRCRKCERDAGKQDA